MTDAALERYQARMQRVLDHIDGHPDGDLGLEALSRVAAFSKHHFHRQFTGTFGISVHRYVQLARMKRASYRLAFRQAAGVTEVALDAGYEAPEAFARAFRQRFGQLPSEFRKAPDWDRWLAGLEPFNNARGKLVQKTFSAQDVDILEVQATPVAMIEHRGDPRSIGSTIQRFIAWRKAQRLNPRNSATYNVFHSDPRTTPAAEYRLDLCVATEREVEPNGEGVVAGLIPGGRCAALRVIGGSDDLEEAALYLYRDWLPGSGEDLRDLPLYCRRVSFFPDVPEHEAITVLYLPLK